MHRADDGDLLIVALLFELGRRNEVLAKMFDPNGSPNNSEQGRLFQLQKLLPRNSDYYRYNGSLTLPPCTEGVRWIVMRSPLVADQTQIDDLRARLEILNSRPPQPLYARVIMK